MSEAGLGWGRSQAKVGQLESSLSLIPRTAPELPCSEARGLIFFFFPLMFIYFERRERERERERENSSWGRGRERGERIPSRLRAVSAGSTGLDPTNCEIMT